MAKYQVERPKEIDFTHKIRSYSGGETHVVEYYKDGTTGCDCMAGQYKRLCRHQKELLNNLDRLKPRHANKETEG